MPEPTRPIDITRKICNTKVIMSYLTKVKMSAFEDAIMVKDIEAGKRKVAFDNLNDPFFARFE